MILWVTVDIQKHAVWPLNVRVAFTGFDRYVSILFGWRITAGISRLPGRASISWTTCSTQFSAQRQKSLGQRRAFSRQCSIWRGARAEFRRTLYARTI